MNMAIDGLACFGAFGAGPEALDAALARRAVAFSPEVDTASLARYIPARALRQCDRHSRLALLGACAALEDAGIDPASFRDGRTDVPARYGLVLAGGYGTSSPTFSFLDSLLDFGEGMASPLAFSHSVQSIPAAIIARNLGLTGPCSTVSQLETSVAAGLLLAGTWLGEGRVDRVLFGAVDEATPTLAAVTAKLVAERSGRPDAALPTRKNRPVTEGAVFFCLSRGGGKSRGRITAVRMSAAYDVTGAACLGILRAGGEKPAACFLSGRVPPALRQACGGLDGGAAYGNIPVAQAFDCVAALCVLNRAGNEGKYAVCMERGRDMHSMVTLERGRGV